MHALQAAPTRRFTVDEVLRMVALGLIHEDEPVELLHGRLVLVSPQGPLHTVTILRIARALRAVLLPGEEVREEKPLACPPHDLPEPDVCIARGTDEAWAVAHPTGADAVLVVEVAMTSVQQDREKAAIYAEGGVPLYWLVDLGARKVETYAGPMRDGRYREVRVLGEDDELALPDRGYRARVGDLLP